VVDEGCMHGWSAWLGGHRERLRAHNEHEHGQHMCLRGEGRGGAWRLVRNLGAWPPGKGDARARVGLGRSRRQDEGSAWGRMPSAVGKKRKKKEGVNQDVRVYEK
jgi:hypothetical protein